MSWPRRHTLVLCTHIGKYDVKRDIGAIEKGCETPEDDEKHHNPAIETEQMLLFYIINFSFSITSFIWGV